MWQMWLLCSYVHEQVGTFVTYKSGTLSLISHFVPQTMLLSCYPHFVFCWAQDSIFFHILEVQVKHLRLRATLDSKLAMHVVLLGCYSYANYDQRTNSNLHQSFDFSKEELVIICVKIKISNRTKKLYKDHTLLLKLDQIMSLLFLCISFFS